MSEAEIICERRGAAGVVTLNRPKALNALTHAMVDELAGALDRWESDDAVTRVIVVACGERAFCAGGDIRALRDFAVAGDYDRALDFWRDEYRLNIRIKRYPKPYVALIDGLVMGGGVGLSLHGGYRVAGERYRFAMPEVGIGFFPDVGATYALPRLPGASGTYLALTGARVGGADAMRLGLATQAVPSAGFGGLLDALVGGEPVERVLERAARDPGEGALTTHRPLIDTCFGAPTLVEVFERLEREAAGSDFALDTLRDMRTKSPTSLAIAFAQMRRGARMSFEAAMATEFRIVYRVVRGPDFREGVRAAIIDKDSRPLWRPDTVDGVSQADVEAYFAPLEAGPFEADSLGVGPVEAVP